MQQPRPAPHHANNFDLIRLFGALQVAWLHTIFHLGLEPRVPAAVSWVVNRFPGVPIFFVVSGFLVTASLQRSASVREYAWNRALRIYPALWACFLVTLGILTWLGAITLQFRATTFWPWVIAQTTFIQFYNPGALRTVGVGVINGSLWTIPVELGFYVLLPMLWLARRRARFPLFLVVVATISFAIWTATLAPSGFAGKLVSVSPLPHLWMFLCGTLAQLYREQVLRLVRGRALFWVGLYLGVAFLLRSAPATIMALTHLLLGMAVLSVAFTLPGTAQRALRGNDISYGVYIYHMLFVNVLVSHGAVGQWSAVAIVLLASVAAASASWVLVERPALRLKRRRSRVASPVAEAGATMAESLPSGIGPRRP